ncbi:MAG: hypothetical protein K8S13_04690 [Desulfobacula sp.]|uniref:hypothetical protein n=1 Tax=Desulfobacula sp. TaxID=2593537 RepID=UPI0025BDF766|nr:hypothetical protein [Desulfobacula sp.]MCD4719143.1 hypothetical protein [Desulfobacula sp.]
MEFDLKEIYQESPKAFRDLIIIFIFAMFVFLLTIAASFDAFEMLVEWSEKYEKFEIDEIFVLLNITLFCDPISIAITHVI